MSKKVETEEVQTMKDVQTIKKADKVVILGTAQTMKDAPFHDESFDIWAVGTAVTHGKQAVPRIDVIFEIHQKHRWDMRMGIYNDRKCPVVMQKHFEEIPESIEYPYDHVINTYGKLGHDGRQRAYMTCSISWMTALAIELGYKEIHYYGVHMATTSEYSFEMPSCEYWIGIAEGKGITCYIPPGADMVKANRHYGYEEPSELEKRLKFHLKDMKQKRVQAERQANEANVALQQYNAAVETLKLVDSWFER
jgi:hypothetical protein